ncbi:hypothetical protein LOK49_LG06G01072 [Camellia lanceoleosa]|uniref:Uncharacterized protein n=1 Tax=Camellia lanceoleosa TaxID=1840588 RepID=A0ACC0HIZ9_9ERIC|nr:hypothetical protein LOK49_LG06G01072 [Camellia lanceoleosa]
MISDIDAVITNGSKSRSSTRVIRTRFLETILITSFLFATILLVIPYQYKNGNPVPTVIFNGIPSSWFHAFVVSLVYAFTGALTALLIHDTAAAFLARFCELVSILCMTSAVSLLVWSLFILCVPKPCMGLGRIL